MSRAKDTHAVAKARATELWGYPGYAKLRIVGSTPPDTVSSCVSRACPSAAPMPRAVGQGFAAVVREHSNRARQFPIARAGAPVHGIPAGKTPSSVHPPMTVSHRPRLRPVFVFECRKSRWGRVNRKKGPKDSSFKTLDYIRSLRIQTAGTVLGSGLPIPIWWTRAGAAPGSHPCRTALGVRWSLKTRLRRGPSLLHGEPPRPVFAPPTCRTGCAGGIEPRAC